MTTASAAVLPFPDRRGDTVEPIDDWGRDRDAVRLAGAIARLRWAPVLGGHDALPAGRPTLLVCNARRFSMSALLVAWAVGRATDRVVRVAGRPGTEPAGVALQRLGSILATGADVGAALRGGDLVVVPAATTASTRRAGAVPPELLEAAWSERVPVRPVAVIGSSLDRAVRIEIGAPVTVRRRRRGPLGPIELSDAVRRSLQRLLDETAAPSLLVRP